MNDFPTEMSSHTQVRYSGRNYSNATLLNIVGIIADVIVGIPAGISHLYGRA